MQEFVPKEWGQVSLLVQVWGKRFVDREVLPCGTKLFALLLLSSW